MRLLEVFSFTIMLIMVAACDAETVRSTDRGVIIMQLASTVNGTCYHLENDYFVIEGNGVYLWLDAGNEEILRQDLEPGSYTIALQDNWRMTRIADDGTREDVNAALESDNPVSFTIESGIITPVSFNFRAGDAVIPFGRGQVAVEINIEEDYITDEHEVIFNKNAAGATGTMAPQILSVGVSAPLHANAFTNSGYTFVGWSTSASGAAVYTDRDIFVMGTADVTLYAVWEADEHEVIFNKNAAGAAGTMAPQILSVGVSAPLNANAFTNSGYTFVGWSTSASGGAVYTDRDIFVMGTADVTLYAVWVLAP